MLLLANVSVVYLRSRVIRLGLVNKYTPGNTVSHHRTLTKLEKPIPASMKAYRCKHQTQSLTNLCEDALQSLNKQKTLFFMLPSFSLNLNSLK